MRAGDTRDGPELAREPAHQSQAEPVEGPGVEGGPEEGEGGEEEEEEAVRRHVTTSGVLWNRNAVSAGTRA